MPLPLILIAGAAGLAAGAVVHTAVGIAFTSWTTSPFSSQRRVDFLNSSSAELDKVEALNYEPNPAKLAEMRAYIETLRPTVEKGWREPHLCWAAMRLAAYSGKIHTTSGIGGTWELAKNTYDKMWDVAFPIPDPNAPHYQHFG